MTSGTTPPIPASTSKRSRQLDFLRGVAILLVLAIHIRLEIPEDTPVLTPFFQFFNRIGWVGVDLFFALSGFLVGGLLISELNKYGTIDPKRFLIRRGLKIYPIYYVFFGYLFFMPLLKAAVGGGDMVATFGELWTLYWPNLLFLNGYVGDNPIGHTWSLAIEEHFYIVLPFFLLLLSRRFSMKQITFLCMAVLIPVVAYRFFAVYGSTVEVDVMKETHFRIDALFVGVAIRGVADVWPLVFARLGSYRFILAAVGFSAVACVPYIDRDSKFTLGYLLTTFGSAAVLIGVYQMKLSDIPKLLRGSSDKIIAATCWIGTYSYATYIWHVTFFRILERQVLNVLGYDETAPYAMVTWIVSSVAICAVAIALSALISRMVEIPVLKFRDRFYPSRSTSIPEAVSSSESAGRRELGQELSTTATR